MISVDDAICALLALVKPLGTERISLVNAVGRVLAEPQIAVRAQPPFAASAMDGYAVKGEEVAKGAKFKVIGEAAAGHGFSGVVYPGEAVRIFTGAPVPQGADCVILQEDVSRISSQITFTGTPEASSNIRAAGNDFDAGFTLEPRVLRPNDIALLAAMNIGEISVVRKPTVAVISTGDELVLPGETPGPDQIIVSNTFGLNALLTLAGADVRLLPIAKDHPTSIKMVFDLARGADLIVTIGGASVGDHDLVGQVARDLGLEQSFYKVAMRPGKPLMAGRLNDAMMIGLPGNPVSAMVCGHVFVLPVIRAMLGLEPIEAPRTAPLAAPVCANGPRAHYMRATLKDGNITIFERQDSALLSVLGQANALVIRPIDDPAQSAGAMVSYIPI